MSRTIWRIEVSDGLLFCIFHALSFELNLIFDRTCPLMIDSRATGVKLPSELLVMAIRCPSWARASSKFMDPKFIILLPLSFRIFHIKVEIKYLQILTYLCFKSSINYVRPLIKHNCPFPVIPNDALCDKALSF